MRLIDNIQQVPRAIDPLRGQAVVDLWGATGDLAELLRGAAGTSPYLNGVLAQQAEWLADAVTQDAPVFQVIDGLQNTQDPAKDLRIAKQRVGGYLALAELARAHDVLEGTSRLSLFADTAVQLAFSDQIGTLIGQGKLPPDTRWFVIAMGKMGAQELNFSSDIDIIVFVDDTDMPSDSAFEIRSQMVKATRRAHKMLTELRPDGYVFRTDLRLRPDPSVTPVCVLTSQALHYYESLGRTWERAAYIKARVCAGDLRAGEAFLSELVPFVWRKYLDFAAIQEAHDLRIKIWEQGQHGKRIVLNGHDVKLGRGGIRDIEFFTQTRQLIAGGRDSDLRHRATLPALASLGRAGWLDGETVQIFSKNYKSLRYIEHAVQMMRDVQTQSLPNDDAGLDAIAALLGTDLATFKADAIAMFENTHDIANSFFDPPKTDVSVPEFDTSLSDRWPEYPALRTQRAAILFEDLKPKILSGLAKATRPETALMSFDSFLKGLPAGVQVFSLFASNPKLTELFVDIVTTAPALAQYLGRNAQVLDSVVSGNFFAPWPGLDGIIRDLGQKASATPSYEDQLDGLRAVHQDWHFRIGVHLIRGIITPVEAVQQYSDLAEAVIEVAAKVAETEFRRKFGAVPGARWAILGMGSLGARAVSANSDLDLMVIFDADPSAESDGPKSLSARPYFGRLTQSLITALTAQMPNGRLYEVDMRLRPSGKAGPIATRIEAFDTYQRHDAWTWEHLALTRARPMCGDAELIAQIEQLRRDIIEEKSANPGIVSDVNDMRGRLAQEKPRTGTWDMKNGPGGLMDIELFAQTRTLFRGGGQRQVGQQLSDDHAELGTMYQTMADLKTLHSVLCELGHQTFDPGPDAWKIIRDHCKIGDLPQLEAQMSQLRETARTWIDTALEELAKD